MAGHGGGRVGPRARGEVGVVVFDWGGVLVRICRSLAEGCARAGLPLPDGHDDTEATRRRRALALPYQRGEIGPEDYYVELSALSGGLWSVEDCRRLHDAWVIEEYDGAADLTLELSEIEGLSTAMLSNTNASHWARQFPGADGSAPEFVAPSHLRTRLASHLLGCAKPERAIYEAAAGELGFAGREAEILFFDDLPDNIEAARACGWRAERIDHTGDTVLQIREHLGRHGVIGAGAARIE